MHIEFKLPTGSGGQAAQYVNTMLDRELTEWSLQYGVPYTKTVMHFQARVELDQDRDYTVFVLTWHYPWPQWRICD